MKFINLIKLVCTVLCIGSVALAGEERKPPLIQNLLGMKLGLIDTGSFKQPLGESGDKPSTRTRDVLISRPFYLGITEVTQAQWAKVMHSNPSANKGSQKPVEMVTWQDAVAFCEKLSALEGRKYRLPTEAEWEWACLSGSIQPCSVPNDSDGWFIDNSGNGYGTHDVATKKANKLGFYDMHGNVGEWCLDWYKAFRWYERFRFGVVVDPTGPSDGHHREKVIKGGSCSRPVEASQWFVRTSVSIEVSRNDVGFRVLLEDETKKDVQANQ